MQELMKLLEKIDPTVFNEATRAELAKLVESKMREADEAGFTRGVAKLNETVEAMKKDKEDSLKQMDESHAIALKKVVDRIDESHTAALKKLVESIDSRHAEMLREALEMIDVDHTTKLAESLKSMDEDHSKKLLQVKEMYEKKYEGRLVEAVDRFLDTFLKESVPDREIADTAKAIRLERMFESFKQLLFVNDDYVQGEVREAVLDAKQQLDEKQKRIDSLLAEKVQANDQMRKIEARNVLEEKTRSMAPAKKAFVKKFFESETDAAKISARLDEAVKAYDADVDKARQAAQETAKDKGISPRIPAAETLTEDAKVSGNDAGNDAVIDEYVQMAERSFRARK